MLLSTNRKFLAGINYVHRSISTTVTNFQNPPKDESSMISYSKTDAPNMPDFNMENPYKREKKLCILCRMKIIPDYRNPRLLSQFVSQFTGIIYGRHITGLCKAKQVMVEKQIRKAVRCGFMPSYHKDVRFLRDPKLFDPENPFRPHKY